VDRYRGRLHRGHHRLVEQEVAFDHNPLVLGEWFLEDGLSGIGPTHE
jgi:hypothetical protein